MGRQAIGPPHPGGPGPAADSTRARNLRPNVTATWTVTFNPSANGAAFGEANCYLQLLMNYPPKCVVVLCLVWIDFGFYFCGGFGRGSYLFMCRCQGGQGGLNLNWPKNEPNLNLCKDTHQPDFFLKMAISTCKRGHIPPQKTAWNPIEMNWHTPHLKSALKTLLMRMPHV